MLSPSALGMSAAYISREGHSEVSLLVALYWLLPVVLKKKPAAQSILPVNTGRYKQMNVCMYVCVFSL